MGTRSRLAVMMALAYAVQGAWWPVLSLHLADLGVSGRGGGWIFATLAIGALVAPPIAGRIADRLLSAQKLLAILFAIGTLLLIAVAKGVASSFEVLFPLFLIYWLVVAPYLGLISTIAMRNLERPREQYGSVRLWGTAGWMTAGWLVAGVLAISGEGRPRVGAHEAFAVAAVLAATLAVFSLILPSTPPLATGRRRLSREDALATLRRPGVMALLLVGFGVSLTTPFVNQAVPVYMRSRLGLPRERIAWAMTFGQMLEIVALGLLPKVMDRLGRKATMGLGISVWVLYHAIFAAGPGLPVALAAISLNGLAIAFFHVAAPLYLDTQAPPDRRAGVQGLWVMTTTGLGALVGGLFAGEVMEFAGDNWKLVFAIPATMAALMLSAFLATFRTGERRLALASNAPYSVVAGSAARGVTLEPKPGEFGVDATMATVASSLAGRGGESRMGLAPTSPDR